MNNLIDMFVSLFSFLTSQLTNIATFFTTSTLGQLILGIGIFSVVAGVVIDLINKKF